MKGQPPQEAEFQIGDNTYRIREIKQGKRSRWRSYFQWGKYWVAATTFSSRTPEDALAELHSEPDREMTPS